MLLTGCAALLAVWGLALAGGVPGLHLLPREAPCWLAAPFLGAAGVLLWTVLGADLRWPALVGGAVLGLVASVPVGCLRALRTEHWWLLGRGAANNRFTAQTIELDEGSDALHFMPRRRPGTARGSTVVLVHGGGNDRLFGLWYLVEELTDAGAAVLSAHLPGHGRSGRDSFSLPACRSRLDDCVRQARATSPGPVVLLGQSLGGALVLDALCRGIPVEGAITVSAPCQLRIGRATVGEARGLLQPHIYRALRYGNAFEALPAAGSFKRAQFPVRTDGDDGYLQVFARSITELALCRRLPERPEPDIPVLLIHGNADGVVPSEQATALAGCLGRAAVLRQVPGMTHLDPLLRRTVVQEIVAWIGDRCGRGGKTQPAHPAGPEA